MAGKKHDYWTPKRRANGEVAIEIIKVTLQSGETKMTIPFDSTAEKSDGIYTSVPWPFLIYYGVAIDGITASDGFTYSDRLSAWAAADIDNYASPTWQQQYQGLINIDGVAKGVFASVTGLGLAMFDASTTNNEPQTAYMDWGTISGGTAPGTGDTKDCYLYVVPFEISL